MILFQLFSLRNFNFQYTFSSILIRRNFFSWYLEQMVKFMDVVGNYIIAIDACVRQLSDKNEQVDFNDNSLELLGSSVFKWILNVTLTKTYGLFSNERN